MGMKYGAVNHYQICIHSAMLVFLYATYTIINISNTSDLAMQGRVLQKFADDS